ncbi:trimeric intracellular cation channel family protein [Pseudactinotalea suaedae]|uniref:trimeric intracellular cation channel family protein n=1 Tax=Pseudactinotalea suaedae TaxID=1524924 RepID=UPI0019D53473|nr:TRIC cation channel family protein [Pseudactinotalea suaedae]
MSTVEIGLTAIGVFAFALSGALMAVRKEMDVVGMFVLAAVTAVGGGLTRDLLLGLRPAALQNPWWWLIVAVATLIVFFFSRVVDRLRRAVLLCDAVGLGLFCATSTTIALQVGLGQLEAILVGTVGGVAGGVLRDVLAGEIPSVLRRDTQLYVVPAVLGCALLAVASTTGLDGGPLIVLAGAAIAVVRILALWRGWKAPAPRPGGRTVR